MTHRGDIMSQVLYDCKRFTDKGWEYLGVISVPIGTSEYKVFEIAEKKYGRTDNIVPLPLRSK